MPRDTTSADRRPTGSRRAGGFPMRHRLPAASRVVGVASFEFETSDDFVASTTLAGFERMRGTESTDEADVLLVRSRPESGPTATVAAIERRRPDVHAFSNEQIVAQVNENG